jgi:hypothetical protein
VGGVGASEIKCISIFKENNENPYDNPHDNFSVLGNKNISIHFCQAY